MTERVYGVDCGGGKLAVVCDGVVPTNDNPLYKFAFSSDEFLNFDWYQGPGVLVTESTTFTPRSTKKASSSSQYFDYKQIMAFLKKCEEKGITIYRFDNNRTHYVVKDFVELHKKKDPRVHKWSNIDIFADIPYQAFTKTGKPTKKKLNIGIKKKDNKYKSDLWEAVVLGWMYSFCPDSLQVLNRNAVYDPDFKVPVDIGRRGRVTEESNFLLLQFKANEKGMDVSCGDFITKNMNPLLGAVAERIENDRGTVRAADLILDYGLMLGKYQDGNINFRLTNTMYPSIFSVCLDRNGNINQGGWKSMRKVLGFVGGRRKSGNAGAALHKYTHERMRKNSGFVGFNKEKFGTRNTEDPHYQLRKTLNKDLEEISRYVYRIFKDLLECKQD